MIYPSQFIPLGSLFIPFNEQILPMLGFGGEGKWGEDSPDGAISLFFFFGLLLNAPPQPWPRLAYSAPHYEYRGPVYNHSPLGGHSD